MLAPAAILAAAGLAVWIGPALPDSVAGLKVLGPYAVLALGVAFALRFNRGRALVLLASLLAAYAGFHYAQGLGGFAAKAVYTALVVLVPLNALVTVRLTSESLVIEVMVAAPVPDPISIPALPNPMPDSANPR